LVRFWSTSCWYATTAASISSCVASLFDIVVRSQSIAAGDR
jgi:hypothetical protein